MAGFVDNSKDWLAGGEGELLPSAGEMSYVSCTCGVVYYIGRNTSVRMSNGSKRRLPTFPVWVDVVAAVCVKCDPEYRERVRAYEEAEGDIAYFNQLFPPARARWELEDGDR